jgi:hypothetical protein
MPMTPLKDVFMNVQLFLGHTLKTLQENVCLDVQMILMVKILQGSV